MKDFIKAQERWQHGDVPGAIRCYQRAAQQAVVSDEERSAAVYMLAYLNLVLAKQAKTEMAVLGIDLGRRHQDRYYQAALCYHQVCEDDFDPTVMGLPVISSYDKKQMREAYDERSYVNRCELDFIPYGWSVDYREYLHDVWVSMTRMLGHKVDQVSHAA